jgi:hypothetical protein
MEGVCIFYGHLVYFSSIWYMLGPFGMCVCQFNTNIFFPFCYVVPRKIWQTCHGPQQLNGRKPKFSAQKEEKNENLCTPSQTESNQENRNVFVMTTHICSRHIFG